MAAKSKVLSKTAAASLPEIHFPIICYRNPIQGGSVFVWFDMEGNGFVHLPPGEPHTASRLLPTQKSSNFFS